MLTERQKILRVATLIESAEAASGKVSLIVLRNPLEPRINRKAALLVRTKVLVGQNPPRNK